MSKELSESHRKKILIVDDQLEFHVDIRKAIPFRQHYDFGRADNVKKLREILNSGEKFDLVLLDLVLDEEKPEEKTGLTLIPEIRSSLPDTPIVVATQHRDIEFIVEATKLGAADFIYKGEFLPETWEEKIRDIIEKSRLGTKYEILEQELQTTKAQLQKVETKLQEANYEQPPNAPFIGVSPKIEGIRKALKAVANERDMSVLILGETGVGKGVAARFLHHNIPARRDKPFEEIHISTISASLLESILFGAKKGTYTGAIKDQKGRLEMANGGTVFLDEIGELSGENQIKLLQFLQSKTVRPIGGEKDVHLDVQIVTATNKVLRDEVARGNFREDLYYRINEFKIEIPPLRERREDIEPLLLHFLNKTSITELDAILHPDVKRTLIDDCPWYGNVRQLESALKSMNADRGRYGLSRITMECVPNEIFDQPIARTRTTQEPALIAAPPTRPSFGAGLSFKEQNAWNELAAIEELLEKKNGVKRDVADELGLSTPTLVQYRIAKYQKIFPHLITVANFPRIRKHYYKLFE